MSVSVQKGTVARILSSTTRQHNFLEGNVVTALGEDFPPHHLGTWANFEDHDGHTQFLLPSHYEVISTPTVKHDAHVKAYEAHLQEAKAAPVVLAEEVEAETGVVEDLPNKVVYGVLNASDEIYATTADRDFARELKAALGGKRKGIRIFQYAAVKEIR